MLAYRNAGFLCLGCLSVMIAGCGGTSITATAAGPPSSPVVYGLNPLQAIRGSYIETSGFGPSGVTDTGIVTAAIASTAAPLKSIVVQNTIPLGFAPGGAYPSLVGTTAGVAVAPSQSVVFRAEIGNGTDGTSLIAIDPTSVALTSSENPSFSQDLHFDATGIGVGPLGSGQYTTAPFTLPFTTTGLHSVTVSVADVAKHASTTTFAVVVVGSTDSSVLVQIQDASGNAVPGATATITNSLAGTPAQATADTQGVIVLFAAPGTQTVTATDPATGHGGKLSVTLAAGKILDANPDGSVVSLGVS